MASGNQFVQCRSGAVVLNQRHFCPLWDIWQYLETFLIFTHRVCDQHQVGRRQGCLNILQNTGHHLISLIIPKLSVVLKLRNTGLARWSPLFLFFLFLSIGYTCLYFKIHLSFNPLWSGIFDFSGLSLIHLLSHINLCLITFVGIM